IRVWWSAPWTGSESDSLLFAIALPMAGSDPYNKMAIEARITKVCLDQFCVSPDQGLRGYIQPSDSLLYTYYLRHRGVKTWMFRGLTHATAKYILT
ncbi:MAG: hypothetical protein QW710_05865, partial [Pyrobaculum sp.]